MGTSLLLARAEVEALEEGEKMAVAIHCKLPHLLVILRKFHLRYLVKGFIRKVQSQIVRAVRLYVIPVFCTHRKE